MFAKVVLFVSTVLFCCKALCFQRKLLSFRAASYVGYGSVVFFLHSFSFCLVGGRLNGEDEFEFF